MLEIQTPLAQRVDALDWASLRAALHACGFAVTGQVLTDDERAELGDLFDTGTFRSTIDMARHRFGSGRYRYFDHPLPPAIAALRSGFYPHLAPVANDWLALLGASAGSFPGEHEQLLARCRTAGQCKPTPLILRYGASDWNALHQDLYGEVFFPFQIVSVLSSPEEFTGGQFVLVEQRPRAQSRAHVIEAPPGAFVIFPTRERPERGARGYHRNAMRHGVSTVTSGSRTALGIIFHDAR